MNAAEHIVQAFLWEADSRLKKSEKQRYLTIPNVIGRNNSEVDILAMSGDGADRLRIECEISINQPYKWDYVESRVRAKMINDRHSRTAVEAVFGTDDYRKIFVVWDRPQPSEHELPDDMLAEQCEVWAIQDLLADLMNSVGTANYQDDILRLISMISSTLSTNNALRRIGCGHVSADVCQIPASTCIDVVAKLSKKIAADLGHKTVSARHLTDALSQIQILCDGL
jgi:hypothetical protein